MKSRRVGTISMAIILIIMGVLIFISQINEVSAVDMAFKLWPLTLVLLGIEILWARYRSSDEAPIIKYDIFSIFIVLIILIGNIGMYAVAETGIMKVVKSRIVQEQYNFELPSEEFVIDESVEKIIVEGFRNSISIRSSENSKIVSRGSMTIYSDSEENAKDIYNKNLVNIEKIDNIVYIKYKDSNDYNLRDLSLQLPSNKKVEIKGGNQLDLVIDTLNNNWVVDGVDNVRLRLSKDLDMLVSTLVRDEDRLSGNVLWTEIKIGTEENQSYKGELVFGEGTNTLNILNVNQVTADEI